MLNRIVAQKLSRDGAAAWNTLVLRSAGTAASASSSSTSPTAPSDTNLSSGLAGGAVKRSEVKQQKISRAMKAYLERARAHDAFMAKENDEFSLGRRHLANIMGWDPENISQNEIDQAIAYLFPSGLFEPRARPLMKPPEEVFPREKAAEFDFNGRPFHYLFYTARPNFYDALHDSVTTLVQINKKEVHMYHKGVKTPSEKSKADLEGSRWMTKQELETLFVETIKDEQYDYFLCTMNRLAEHPYSNNAKDFLMRFRKHQAASITQQDIPPLKHDDAGNPFIEAKGERKSSRAKAIVRGNGTGRVTINGGLSVTEYFDEVKDRLQIMFPLQFTGLLNKVDIDVTIYRKKDAYEVGEMAELSEAQLIELREPLALRQGSTCEAGAIRLAVARALCSFVTKQDVELMRLAGLLTRDPRVRERKKPGQEGARRKYTWLKR